MSYGPEHRAKKTEAREAQRRRSCEQEEQWKLWDECAADGGHVFILHARRLSFVTFRCAGCGMRDPDQ